MIVVRRALEAQIERRVARDALGLGVRSLKLTMRYDAGWPDRVFLLPRRPLWAEFKRPGDGPTPLQRERLEFLDALGYDTAVFDDYDEAMGKIDLQRGRRRAREP